MRRALQQADARAKLAVLVAYVVAALHARGPYALGACTVLALALALAVRLSRREVLFVLRPFAPVLVVTVVMQVLYVQQGEVLALLGPVRVTTGALWEAGRMLVALFCVMLASVAFMRCTTVDDLTRALSWMLLPLRKIGVRTDAFVFALNVAFRFVPVLVDQFRQLKCAQQARLGAFDGGARVRLRSYARLFAPLVRNAFARADTLAQASYSRCFGTRNSPSA